MAAYTDIVCIVGGAASNSYVSPALRLIHTLRCNRGNLSGWVKLKASAPLH